MTLFLVKCSRQHPGGKTEICDLLMSHADESCDLELRVLREREVPCPGPYKMPTCALCHFVPFRLPPQAQKNFCANRIIKQQVLGLNAPGGVFIPPFSDPLLPNFSTPRAAALQSSPLLSTRSVFLSYWQ